MEKGLFYLRWSLDRNHIMDWQFTSNQGWPETCGRQVQLNNLASLELDVL